MYTDTSDFNSIFENKRIIIPRIFRMKNSVVKILNNFKYTVAVGHLTTMVVQIFHHLNNLTTWGRYTVKSTNAERLLKKMFKKFSKEMKNSAISTDAQTSYIKEL